MRNLRWLLIVVATAVMVYGGYQWSAAQPLSRSEMRLAVDQAYRADVTQTAQAKNPNWVPDSSWENNHRKAAREKITKQTQHQAEVGKSWFLVGVALLILIVGNLFLVPWSRHLTDRNR